MARKKAGRRVGKAELRSAVAGYNTLGKRTRKKLYGTNKRAVGAKYLRGKGRGRVGGGIALFGKGAKPRTGGK